MPSADVRFYGDTKVCTSDECVIEMINDGSPFTFNINIIDGKSWELVPVVLGETDWSSSILLSNQGQITLHEKVERWILKKTTSISIPMVYTLHPAYPNPLNPITTIRYDLPESGIDNLSIYDMRGRQITQLVNKIYEPGFRSVVWDGTDKLDRPVSAGVYLYQIQADGFVQTRKMVLLK